MSNKYDQSFVSEDDDIIPKSPGQPKKKFKFNNTNSQNREDLSKDEHLREELQFLQTADIFSNTDFCSNMDITLKKKISPSVLPKNSSSIDVSEELEFLKSVDFSSTLACFGNKKSCKNVESSHVPGSTLSSTCTLSPSSLAGSSAPQPSNLQKIAATCRAASASRTPPSRNVALPPSVGRSTSFPSGTTKNVMRSTLNHRMHLIDGIWHYEDDSASVFSVLPTDKLNAEKVCIRKGGYNLSLQDHTLKVSKNKMSFIFHNHKDFLNYTETRLPKHNNVKMVGTFSYSSNRCFLKEYNASPNINKDVFVIINLNIPHTVPNIGNCIEAYGFVELELFGSKKLPILNVLFWKPVKRWCQKKYLKLLETQKLFVPSDYKEELVVNAENPLDATYMDILNDVTQLFNGTLKV